MWFGSHLTPIWHLCIRKNYCTSLMPALLLFRTCGRIQSGFQLLFFGSWREWSCEVTVIEACWCHCDLVLLAGLCEGCLCAVMGLTGFSWSCSSGQNKRGMSVSPAVCLSLPCRYEGLYALAAHSLDIITSPILRLNRASKHCITQYCLLFGRKRFYITDSWENRCTLCLAMLSPLTYIILLVPQWYLDNFVFMYLCFYHYIFIEQLKILSV